MQTGTQIDLKPTRTEQPRAVQRATSGVIAKERPAAEMATGENIVEFAGVQETYDRETLVVQSLDLDVRRGEFLSLLGPSGSGKTTTSMMLAGFESPTAGEISRNGRPITRTPTHKRNFGMVSQNYALFPHMTIAQNVAYALTVRRTPKSETAKKVANALSVVQLTGKDDRLPAQMSDGQQQQVALARATVFEPQLGQAPFFGKYSFRCPGGLPHRTSVLVRQKQPATPIPAGYLLIAKDFVRVIPKTSHHLETISDEPDEGPLFNLVAPLFTGVIATKRLRV